MTTESINQFAQTENLEILEVLKEHSGVSVLLVKKDRQTRILKIYPNTPSSSLLFNNYERILRKLEQPHSAGQFDNYHYLITNYYGLDLKTMLNRSALSKNQRRQIAINLVNQVEAIHQRKIVHNDIKLSNIVVNKSNQVQLIDFEEAVLLTEMGASKPLGSRKKDVQDLTAVLTLLNPNFGRTLIDKTRTLGVLRTKLKIPSPFRTLRWGLSGAVMVLCSIITFDTVSATVSDLKDANLTKSDRLNAHSSVQMESFGQNSSIPEGSSSLTAELKGVAVESGIADPGVLPLVTVLSSNFNSADPRSANRSTSLSSGIRAKTGVGTSADGATAPEPSKTASPSPAPSAPGSSTLDSSTLATPDPTPTIKTQPTPEPSPDSEVIIIN
jgi:serine/threonine protein kinase